MLLLLPACWEGLCLHNELRVLCNEVDAVYKEVREIYKCTKFYKKKVCKVLKEVRVRTWQEMDLVVTLWVETCQ